MTGITTHINFKESNNFLDKHFTSKYNLNTVKDNGLVVDVKESLISKLNSLRSKKNKSRFLNYTDVSIFPTVSGSAIDDFIVPSKEMYKIVGDVELDLDRKIDEFLEFITQSGYVSVGDCIENSLEARPLPFDTSYLDIDHILPSILDYWETGDTDWIEYEDYGGLLVKNILKYQSDGWYKEFIKRFEDIFRAKRLLKALSKRINFLLNLVKNRLRNLRQVFTKLHSFHFKNLDDYHNTSFNFSVS